MGSRERKNGTPVDDVGLERCVLGREKTGQRRRTSDLETWVSREKKW